MIYFIIALLCSILSGYLFKKASGTISLHSPNMMSVIFYFYFLLNNVIGAILIVNKLDDHYIINKLSSDVYRYYGFWTIMYTIIGFPIGQLVANSLFKKRNMGGLYHQYVSLPLNNEPIRIRRHVKNTLLLLSAISVLAVVYTLITIGGSPLGAMLSGTDELVLAAMRADANRNFGGNQYFRNIFGIGLTPFLSYIAYGYKRMEKSRFNDYWFWTMFASSILILTYDLEKSPILWYFLGFLFFKVYMGYKLSNKTLVAVASGTLGLVVVMYVLLSSMDIDALFVFNQGFIGRMTLSSNAGVFMSYDVFPSNHDFLGFSSFSGVLSDIFGMPHSERSARLVMEFVNPNAVEAGLAGVFNSLFVSEAWANWGLVGVVFSPIYVGFVIQCLYLFLLTNRKTPFFMGLFITYTIRCSINGGINDYIYSTTFLVMGVVYYLVYYFGMGRKYYKLC